MTKFYFLLATILFINTTLSAQAPGIKWQRCVGGQWNEGVASLVDEADNVTYPTTQKGMVPAKDGGYFILGQTNSADGDVPINSVNNQPGTMAVLKLDSARNVVWKRTLGGLQWNGLYDMPASIIETSDRGCIVIGETGNTTGDAVGNHGGKDIIIGKFSNTGTLQWAKMFGGSSNEYASSIVQTADSGYIFLGTTVSTSGQVQGNHGGSDGWMVKLDKTGNIAWQKCLGTAAGEQSITFQKLGENKFLYVWYSSLCAGYTFTALDSLGNTINQNCFSGIGFASISQTTDNGFILAGRGPNSSGNIIKVDSSFNIQWQKILNGSGDDRFSDAKQTPDGGYIVAGATSSLDGDLTGLGGHLCTGCSAMYYDSWIVKLNSAGQVEWQKVLGGSFQDFATAVYPTPDNNYLFFGITGSHDGDVSGHHTLSTQTTIDWWLVELGAANTIEGYAFADKNNNGIKDAGENYTSGLRIRSMKGSDEHIAIPAAGQYKNYVDTGNYITTITPDNPYYTVTPSTHNSSFSTYNNSDTVDIAVQAIPGIRDLSVNIIPTTAVRPGFQVRYKMSYQNKGTDSLAAGTVMFVKSTQLKYQSALPLQTTIVGDTIKWNISNLLPGEVRLIDLIFTANQPPKLNIGDMVKAKALINPVSADTTKADNYFELKQTAAAGYDPNNKTESHAGKISLSKLADREYLQYTINFQNTGSDTAFNVYVRDTLDDALDWATLRMVNTSHPFELNIDEGNRCVWAFKNIALPDSNKNELLSHGYISYFIKAKNTVSTGDTIRNRAAIFFDFNAAVFTNTENTIVSGNLLPIKLVRFEARKEGQVNRLQWVVAAEVDSKEYLIERSLDAKDYNQIGSVTAGSGAYNFVDNKPAIGINYYRLRLIQKDGVYTFSPVRVVINSGSSIVAVYPNPAKENLQLQIQTDKKTKLAYQIAAADGKIMIEGRTSVEEGVSSKTIPVISLPKGVYYLKISSQDNQQQILKFEKL